MFTEVITHNDVDGVSTRGNHVLLKITRIYFSLLFQCLSKLLLLAGVKNRILTWISHLIYMDVFTDGLQNRY